MMSKAAHFSVAGFMFGCFLLVVSTRPNETIAPQGASVTPPSVHFVDIAARGNKRLGASKRAARK